MNDYPRIVLIGCSHSAGVAIEELAGNGQALPDNVEWVSMSCGAAIDELHILRAFESGADQVMVLVCCDGACRSLSGGQWAEKRVNATRIVLEEVGIDGWRLELHKMAPNMSVDLLQWLEAFREPVQVAESD